MLREASNQLEVLVIRKRGGMWTLPKGRVKRGECDEDALKRELEEETGLCGEIGEPIAQSRYQVQRDGRLRRKTVVYYLVANPAGKLRPGIAEGIAQVRWMPISRALKRIGRPRIRAIVRSALTLVVA